MTFARTFFLLLFGLCLLRSTALALPAKLLFEGNEHLGSQELRQAAVNELEDFAQLGQRKAEIDDAAFQMENRYKQAGFAFASVSYRYLPTPSELQVTFIVTEGPQVGLQEITFSGNQAYLDDRLRQLFFGEAPQPSASRPLFYVADEVTNGIDRLLDFYYNEGYLEVAVSVGPPLFNPERSKVALTIAVEEHERHLIRQVEFSGELLPELAEELQRLQKPLRHEPYFLRRQLILKSQLQELYANRGYPDARIVITSQPTDQAGEVILLANIAKGPEVTIAGIAISGNRKTEHDFIVNRLALKEGEVYSQTAQIESFNTLYQTGLFSRVEMGLEEGADPEHRNLAIRLDEVMARELYLEPGWGSYEQVRSKFGYRDKNFRGKGRIVKVESGVSAKGANILTSYTDPRFLETGITMELPLSFNHRLEPSFVRDELSGSLLFSKNYSKHLALTTGYKLTRAQNGDTNLNTVLQTSDQDYTTASVNLTGSWDNRDDLFFPTSGARHSLGLEMADPLLGSQEAFIRLTGGLRYFQPCTSFFTLGLSYKTGIILPQKEQNNIPLGERFFNGGANTVRSFRESGLGPTDITGAPSGGLAFNVVAMELRHYFPNNLAATFFVDAGNISPNLNRAAENTPQLDTREKLIDATYKDFFRDFRPGIGMGVQYLLPIGPLRLDMAFNPDQREESGEIPYAIHFSIGMAF